MTVKQKQCLLAYLGYYTGEIDGLWGPKSQEATEAFQRAYGLTVDGIFGGKTAGRIREVIASGETPVASEEAPSAPEDGKTGAFWDHIRYWTRGEFKCRCGEYHAPYCNGYPVEPDQTLVELVDDLRARGGGPGIRSSGIRCPQHNADSGGVYNSRHLEGKALDFFIQGMSGEALLALAKADPRTSYAYIIKPGEPYVHVNV